MLPQWPAAHTLLRRAVKVLSSEKGLHHADSSVKQMSVEFTGQVAVQLFKEAMQAEDDEAWVKELLDHAGEVERHVDGWLVGWVGLITHVS
jgi:hypothetical protein